MKLFALLTLLLNPTFYIVSDNQTKDADWKICSESGCRIAVIEDIECRLEETTFRGERAYKVSITNNGETTFTPEKAGLRLGIDTWMDTYPQWLDKWVPTYLLCEQDHFKGYLQTPSGRTLGLFSPDPVASWSLDYNLSYPDPLWFYGHRITSVNLDIMNTLPLPDHHPQHMWKLGPGEKISLTLAVKELDSLETFEAETVRLTDAPAISLEKTCFSKGEDVELKVYGKKPQTVIISPSGKRIRAKTGHTGDGLTIFSFMATEEGEYSITASSCGHLSTGTVIVHRPWKYIMHSARQAAVDNPQKPTSHVESWYGFSSAFAVAPVFPDPQTDRILDERFDFIMSRLYDKECRPFHFASRIQNTSCTIGMLVDRFQAYSRIEDLEDASEMADWLIGYSQAEDGAYMNGGVKYTSVIYVAKSILELSLAEREYGRLTSDPRWLERSERHFESARQAINQLVNADGDFQTEGEMTFEDGMVSCSALQIGMLALVLPPDSPERKSLENEMLKLLASHDCLASLKVPDGRRRGGTIRFWEAQYDVMMLPNMITAPHGWSAWRAYATFYAYLLTGDHRWLLESWNAAGAFSALVSAPEDGKDTGKVRWAFVVDPYVKARQTDVPVPGYTCDSLSFGNPHPDLYPTKKLTIGEQYVDMISSWQGINTQDNDVHEVFRFISEAFVKNAFVIEHNDGSLSCYNCTIKDRHGMLTVIPKEKQITRLHLNLLSGRKVEFLSITKQVAEGCSWFEGSDLGIFN